MQITRLMCANCKAPLIQIPSVRKRIECADGVTLSVQASSSAYCTPRDNDGPYTEVEVGFIDGAIPPETWREHADSYDDNGVMFPSDVYAYVPVALVEAFIAEHGGRKYFT